MLFLNLLNKLKNTKSMNGRLNYNLAQRPWIQIIARFSSFYFENRGGVKFYFSFSGWHTGLHKNIKHLL